MTTEELFEILKAQIDTATVPGLVSSQDVEEFIDLTREQTAILQEIRVESDIRKSLNLDTLTLGEPVVIAGVEGTEPAAGDIVAAGHSRATLTPLGDMLLAGPWQRNLSYLGITLLPVYGLGDDKILLTPKENLGAVGRGRSSRLKPAATACSTSSTTNSNISISSSR